MNKLTPAFHGLFLKRWYLVKTPDVKRYHGLLSCFCFVLWLF